MDDLQHILQFWFEETDRQNWFNGGEAFDEVLMSRWRAFYENALDGRYTHWRQTAEGCLGLCLLWDQFPRNAFRGTPRAFATDYLALDISRSALASDFGESLSGEKRTFLYMPLMHSENMDDQAKSVVMQNQLGDPNTLKFAILHAKVIQKFSRYPGRNTVLGRRGTDAEMAFLDSDEGHAF